MIVNEIFNVKIPFTLSQTQGRSWQAEFDVKGQQFEVNFVETMPESMYAESYAHKKYGVDSPEAYEEALERGMPPTYEIAFHQSNQEDADDKYAAADSRGGQFAVFSTVLNIIERVIGKSKPIELFFTGSVDHRDLYEKMVNKLVAQYGYESEIINMKDQGSAFVLVNKKAYPIK